MSYHSRLAQWVPTHNTDKPEHVGKPSTSKVKSKPKSQVKAADAAIAHASNHDDVTARIFGRNRSKRLL